MRKRYGLGLLALAIVAVVTTGCPSRPVIQTDGWLYGDYSSNNGDTIVQQPNGGYFVAGTALFDGEFHQYVCYFLNGDGIVESAFSLPGLFSQVSLGPCATALSIPGAGVYFAGLTQSGGGPDARQGRLRVVKTDTSGNILWDYTYGDENWVPRAITEAPDGGILIAVLNKDSANAQVVKLKPDGEVIWISTPLPGIRLSPNALRALSDGTVAVAGSHHASGIQDPALLFLDADGNEISYTQYPTDLAQEIWSLELAPDGGFYLGGTYMFPNAKRRPYLLKTDANGAFEWDRDDIYLPANAGSDVQVWDMVVDDEGYIAMVGDELIVDYIGTIPVMRGNSFLMRLDPTGTLARKTNISGLTYGIDFTQQGTYITTGVADQYIRVLELDKNGNAVN